MSTAAPAHPQLPACPAQEMTAAGLQWKLFTATAKNSGEVKEVGTHSLRVISSPETSGLRRFIYQHFGWGYQKSIDEFCPFL